jgi:hypothetical protein
MVVPIKLATTTLRIEVGIPVFSPPILSISASSKKRFPPIQRNYIAPACTALWPADRRSRVLERQHLAGQRAL